MRDHIDEPNGDQLRNQNPRAECGISLETLVGYCDKTLPAEAEAVLTVHLDQGCSACTESISWLAPLLANLHGAGQIKSPSFSLARSKALFRERLRSNRRPPLIARLLQDSRLTPALGQRGGPGSSFFQLVYGTVSHDIDLWHEPQQDGTWYLIGQVLPHEGTAVRPNAAMMTAADGRQFDLLLEGAEFHAASLAVGDYELVLDLPGGSVLVPEIHVGA